MGKKYLETKKNTLESSIIGVWEDAAKLNEYKTKLGERKRVSGGDGRRTENKKLKGVEVTEGSKEEYEKFFNAAMKKFKINSPADLKSDEEKKKFFDYVDKNYTGEKNEEFDLDEGTKQVLAHGGKGKYKVTKDGDTIEIKFGGKVVGTADFDRGADSFFVSIKGEKGQKSFDDAQAIADYFAKNKITEEVDLDEAVKHMEVPPDGPRGRGVPMAHPERIGYDSKENQQAYNSITHGTPDNQIDTAKHFMKKGLKGKQLHKAVADHHDVIHVDVHKQLNHDKKKLHPLHMSFVEEDELEKQHEMRMYDMKDAVRKVWEASDREKIENKREKSVKAKPGKTMTGDDMSEIEINPKIKG